MEFEVIKVEKQNQRLRVEIEFPKTRERKGFGYPLGEGWEDENSKGEPKFLEHIRRKIKDEEEVDKQKIDVEKINKSLKGKKIKTE